MADEVRMWQVTKDDKLAEIKAAKLDREERIEKWITQDVSVLDPDETGLLVIGEQVRTDFGKEIDLLCIDSEGNLVIVELKRDKTPREVTAQALDYASWVKDLGAEEIEKIATEHFKDGETLKDHFERAFDKDFPDVINGDHSMKIVASEIDDSTERIIRYLSERGIDINVVRFRMFQADGGPQLLVRTFTVPPEEAEQHTRRGGRTKRTSSFKTLETRLEESTNEAEGDFITKLLAVGQETNKRRSSFRYRVLGKIRWYVRPRADFVNVIQRGRFDGDEQLWTSRLSKAGVVHRRGGSDLGFYLHTKADFDAFQDTMEQDAANFQWQAANKGGAEPAADEENE